jgi:SET domain-containing protein
VAGKKTYKPLPDGLTIAPSMVHGLGLFAEEDFDKIIRTPLGGFLNHSEEPNCQKIKRIKSVEDLLGKWSDIYFDLVSIKPIKKGSELTIKYTLYKP